MNIIVFCDTIGQFPRFWQAFEGAPHNLHFLVCNNARRRAAVFLLVQIVHGARHLRLRTWLRLLLEISRGTVRLTTTKLGEKESLRFLSQVNPKVGLHAMGVIYRREIIDRCGDGILNAHIGQLPYFRGRSAMEWSFLCGAPTGITVFFIDDGIDTGSKVVHWRPVSISGFRSVSAAKRYLFSLDAETYRTAVDKIVDNCPFTQNNIAEGYRFYEMSSLFRSVVAARLATTPPPP